MDSQLEGNSKRNEDISKISSTTSKNLFKKKHRLTLSKLKEKIPVDTNQHSGESGKKSQPVKSDSEEEDVFEDSSEKGRKTYESTKKPKIVIVMAGLSKDAKKLVINATKSLPKIARIDKNVTDQTTHIISTEKTNIKVLKGIAMGCWILRIEWISKSLEKEQWINPETYEIADFGRAVRKNREHRQLFGKSFVHHVFSKCRKMYVGEGTTVCKENLLKLITLAGGKIEKSQKSAKIVIGLGGLKETWIFNSIKNGKVEPVKPYRIREIL